MLSHNPQAISNNGLSYKRLISIFNSCFLDRYNTQLEDGHDEPLYLPEKNNQPARLCFREDFASSALHEIAHWCIAGDERRQLVDFGYWYEPDGRSQKQQVDFEKVEVKPQALECIFSLAAGIKFSISVDNLDGQSGASPEFTQSVQDQVREYFLTGIPDRAEIFYKALLQASGYPEPNIDFNLFSFQA